MGTFSDANWDVPPGTGYLTAAGLGLAAVLTLAYALRWPVLGHRSAPAESALVGLPADVLQGDVGVVPALAGVRGADGRR
jgi:hypothetical protein